MVHAARCARDAYRQVAHLSHSDVIKVVSDTNPSHRVRVMSGFNFISTRLSEDRKVIRALLNYLRIADAESLQRSDKGLRGWHIILLPELMSRGKISHYRDCMR